VLQGGLERGVPLGRASLVEERRDVGCLERRGDLRRADVAEPCHRSGETKVADLFLQRRRIFRGSVCVVVGLSTHDEQVARPRAPQRRQPIDEIFEPATGVDQAEGSHQELARCNPEPGPKCRTIRIARDRDGRDHPGDIDPGSKHAKPAPQRRGFDGVGKHDAARRQRHEIRRQASVPSLFTPLVNRQDDRHPRQPAHRQRES